jgi:hypothetical protein
MAETGRDPVVGTVIRTVEIPARHGAAVEVKRGHVLRVIDVDGRRGTPRPEAALELETVRVFRAVIKRGRLRATRRQPLLQRADQVIE